MKRRRSLPVLNCIRKPGRTIALVVLSCMLCFCILAGSLLISGLRSGLESLEARLGADIMVVPYEAKTKSKLSSIILQGIPGYFYMDNSIVDKIAGREGIDKLTEQFFLASAAASCCSFRVQLIGFDPDTDFAILPWVNLKHKGGLGYLEVFVGNDLNAFIGDQLKFYGTAVTVAARLDRTGTYIDRAVFANKDTIKTLIASAKEKAIYDFGSVNPDKIVSCVLINVAEGYSVEEVLNDINIHVKKVEAIQTASLITDVSEKLRGVSDVAGGLVVVIWLLVLAIMMLAFLMMANERKKEFAILRVLGASRRKLAGVLFSETLMISLAGSIAGAFFSVISASLFSSMIEEQLSLPFLLPGTGKMAALICLSIILSVACSAAASVLSAVKTSKVDTAFILRGDN